jgi:hypothetical protein
MSNCTVRLLFAASVASSLTRCAVDYDELHRIINVGHEHGIRSLDFERVVNFGGGYFYTRPVVSSMKSPVLCVQALRLKRDISESRTTTENV